MWQTVVTEIIVVLAMTYTIYNGVKFFIPKRQTGHTKCSGCSGDCGPQAKIDLNKLKQMN